jgi:hypothetical protein
MGGYDTASRVESVWPAAQKYGNPRYWLRYFNPSPGDYLLEDAAVAECQAIYNSGGPYLGPIMAPTQSRLGNTTYGASWGLADAQAFVTALNVAYNAVGPLDVPYTQTVYCYLDQEYNTSLCIQYWNAWAEYVGEYNFGDLGTLPLYPCLYCSPALPPPNCSVIDSEEAFGCAGVWTPEYQKCGNDLNNISGWDVASCSLTPTILWQFHEDITADSCSLTVNVDMDVAQVNYPDYCFIIAGPVS